MGADQNAEPDGSYFEATWDQFQQTANAMEEAAAKGEAAAFAELHAIMAGIIENLAASNPGTVADCGLCTVMAGQAMLMRQRGFFDSPNSREVDILGQVMVMYSTAVALKPLQQGEPESEPAAVNDNNEAGGGTIH